MYFTIVIIFIVDSRSSNCSSSSNITVFRTFIIISINSSNSCSISNSST